MDIPVFCARVLAIHDSKAAIDERESESGHGVCLQFRGVRAIRLPSGRHRSARMCR